MGIERLKSVQGENVKKEFITGSADETIKLGKALGEIIPAGTVISLEGGLGCGKTMMVKGICQGLGVSRGVLSPSFVLLEEYQGEFPIFHYDLYRLEELSEVEGIGLLDSVDGRNIVLIEWGDRLPDGFIEKDIVISMEITGEKERRVLMEAPADILEALDER